MNSKLSLVFTVCVACSAPAFGDVVIHTTYASWSSAIGRGDAKIDFNLGSAQEVFDQYAGLGVHFGGTAQTGSIGPISDGWVATSLFPTFAIDVTYDAPQYGVAFDLMSLFKVSLYAGNQLLYQSPQLNTFAPVFRGLTTDFAFDRAVIQSIPGNAGGLIDNLYVANPVPAPSGVAALAAFLASSRRRRRA